jgi:transposase
MSPPSDGTCDRLVARYRATGDVALTPQKYGCDPKLDAKGVEAVPTLLEQPPDRTLPVRVAAVAETSGMTVRRPTVVRTVRERLGWTRKK